MSKNTMHDGTATASRPGTGNTPAPAALRKSLKNRHVQLIALGGAIGTGLFYGSSESIALAGPSILLAYLVGGLAIFMIVRALGEMSVEDPRAGAFSYYATRYWSKRAGFVSGWNYWFNYILVSMVELSVVGSFVNYWFPAIPQWVSAAVFLVVIAAMNLLGVSKFGEFEFWFALIKIVAVIAMIVGGLAVLIAGLPTDSGVKASFSNWFALNGGVLPHGLLQQSADGQWTGLLMALVVVMFSFGGTELIGITAGETEDPRRTIPRATNGIIWRILVFYIGALGVIMAVVPWNTIDGTTSPFVQIFDSVGVHAAAGILNFVCLTAVMSVYNSGLYANSRMLYSLARQGNAPEILGKLNFHGVPVVGVLASAAIRAGRGGRVPVARFRVQLSDVDRHDCWRYQLVDDHGHRDSFPSPCGGRRRARRAGRAHRRRGSGTHPFQAAVRPRDAVCSARIPGIRRGAHVLLVQLSRRRHRRCGVACDSADRIPGHADAQDRPPLVAHIPRMEPWPPHARTEPAHHNPTRRTQVTTKSPQTLRSAIFLGLARDHLSRTREYRRKPGKGLTSRPC